VVDYYRCDWNINPAVRYISGSVTSYFTITTATSEIVYDLSKQLTVDSVRLHKKLLSFSQKVNNTVVIHFSTTLSAGKRDSVSVFYHGTPPDTGYFAQSFVQTTHGNNVPVLWTLSEPFAAMGGGPCRNGLDDKADSIDIYITHPSQYRASSNGLPVSEITTGGSVTSHYKHRYPIASYLVGIAVTNYSVDSRLIPIGSHNVPLIQYVYPEDLTTFQNNTFTVSQALQLYSSYFGLYPFAKERYGQTEFSRGGGMEHQTNSFVASATENLMTHELGHQWFGDKVTCGSWQDIWLNEGFRDLPRRYVLY
jgi:aminopeptidase N